jgi:hypothetical protein
MKLRERRTNKDDNYRRWWVSDEAPSPAILAFFAVVSLSGLFAGVVAIIEAILKQ